MEMSLSSHTNNFKILTYTKEKLVASTYVPEEVHHGWTNVPCASTRWRSRCQKGASSTEESRSVTRVVGVWVGKDQSSESGEWVSLKWQLRTNLNHDNVDKFTGVNRYWYFRPIIYRHQSQYAGGVNTITHHLGDTIRSWSVVRPGDEGWASWVH